MFSLGLHHFSLAHHVSIHFSNVLTPKTGHPSPQNHQKSATSASAARILALSVRPWSNSIEEKEAGRWRNSWRCFFHVLLGKIPRRIPFFSMFCWGKTDQKTMENPHPITKTMGKPRKKRWKNLDFPTWMAFPGARPPPKCSSALRKRWPTTPRSWHGEPTRTIQK